MSVKAYFKIRSKSAKVLIHMARACPKSIIATLNILLEGNLKPQIRTKIKNILKVFNKFVTQGLILLEDIVLDAYNKVFMLFESNELDFAPIQTTINQQVDYLTTFLEKEPLSTEESDDEQFAEFLLQVEEDCEILGYDEEMLSLIHI